jgi:hypothetical protein
VESVDEAAPGGLTRRAEGAGAEESRRGFGELSPVRAVAAAYLGVELGQLVTWVFHARLIAVSFVSQKLVVW